MVIEVSGRHTRRGKRLRKRDVSGFIIFDDVDELGSVDFSGASETDAFFLCRSYAFRLPGADILGFVFGDEGQDLQHYV